MNRFELARATSTTQARELVGREAGQRLQGRAASTSSTT